MTPEQEATNLLTGDTLYWKAQLYRAGDDSPLASFMGHVNGVNLFWTMEPIVFGHKHHKLVSVRISSEVRDA